MHHAMRRVLSTVVVVAVMLEAAWQVLGPPEIGRAISFLDGGIPTLNEGEAVTALIAWAVILVASAAALAGVMSAIGWARLLAQPSARAAMFLVAGLLLLAVSAIQRAVPTTLVCCASGPSYVREAIQLAR